MAAKKRTVSEATRHKLSLAGKRRWRAMSSAQKAKATSRLRSGSKRSSRRSSTSVSKRSNPGPNRPPKIGSMYQAGKGTHALLAPAIATASIKGLPKDEASLRAALKDLKARAGLPYAVSLAIETASQALDHKFQHATALSKASVTAWAVEVYALALAILSARAVPSTKERIDRLNLSLGLTMRAYNSRTGKIQALPQFWLYQGAKVGGGLARRLSSMPGPLRKVLSGPKKLLKFLGVRA